MVNSFNFLCALVAASTILMFLRNRWSGAPPCLAPFDVRRTMPIRGLLALLVVIGHCDSLAKGSEILHYIHWATPAVAVFFFLSGYGLFKSMEARPGEYLGGLPLRSLVKLGVPLLVAAVVMCLCLKLGGHDVRLLARLRAMALRGSNFPPHSWYVWSLFFLYAYFWLSFRFLPRRAGIAAFALLTTAHFAMLRWGLRWQKWWWLTVMSMPVGVVWASCEERIASCVRRLSWRFYALALLYMALLAAAWQMLPNNMRLARNFVHIAVYMAMGPAVALSAYAIRGLPRALVAPFAFLGRISFEIYLLHFVGERIIRKSGWGPWTSLLVVLAATLPLAYAAHAFDAAVVNKLLGRRKKDERRK
ncbi:MAG: acyltransferase [Kiritimatiellae bacterium]|nr:acyltransferase [Kiritimatiellia bacterium]